MEDVSLFRVVQRTRQRRRDDGAGGTGRRAGVSAARSLSQSINHTSIAHTINHHHAVLAPNDRRRRRRVGGRRSWSCRSRGADHRRQPLCLARLVRAPFGAAVRAPAVRGARGPRERVPGGAARTADTRACLNPLVDERDPKKSNVRLLRPPLNNLPSLPAQPTQPNQPNAHPKPNHQRTNRPPPRCASASRSRRASRRTARPP